jgi:hypothetical protein
MISPRSIAESRSAMGAALTRFDSAIRSEVLDLETKSPQRNDAACHLDGFVP